MTHPEPSGPSPVAAGICGALLGGTLGFFLAVILIAAAQRSQLVVYTRVDEHVNPPTGAVEHDVREPADPSIKITHPPSEPCDVCRLIESLAVRSSHATPTQQ